MNHESLNQNFNKHDGTQSTSLPQRIFPRQSVFKKLELEKIYPKTYFLKKNDDFLSKNKNCQKRPLKLISLKEIHKITKKNQAKRKNTPQKAKNYLWIVFFVKKFADILKSRALETKLQKLQKYHQNIICDLTFFPNNERKSGKIELNNPFYRLYVDIFLKLFIVFRLAKLLHGKIKENINKNNEVFYSNFEIYCFIPHKTSSF